MKKMLAALVALSLALAVILSWPVMRSSCEAKEDAPFRPWNGTWKGKFKVFSYDGKLLNVLKVSQTYTELKPTDQRAQFTEFDKDGKKTTAKARNWVEGGKLLCRVEKSDGSVVTHVGRKLKNGGLCWHRKDKEAQESFFEKVIKEGDQTFYVINGFGIYGKDRKAYYFEGRYQQQKPKPGSK